MNRIDAERILYEKFGIRHFYDEQWHCIERLLNGERLLMIQKTGFGKSLCFQFPAVCFSGITIVFSPLIALMRDQEIALRKLGISVACINSGQENEENERIIQQAIDGEIKILYIAPERMESSVWLDAVTKMNLSMIIIDEAHCISAWGHDFRPAFRRIINLVKLLPLSLPVLATTATATKRVQKDIEQQMGGDVQTIRGRLTRENFRLKVVLTNSEDEKLLWLLQNIPSLEGNGIIYTGTRVSAEIISKWLDYNKISVTSYSAALDDVTRRDVEKGFKDNKWKCIVSTNALGMGIDKPDVRFIIHTQMPQSLVHYYQEIGRGGRDGKSSEIILLFNEAKDEKGDVEDEKLPLSFINTAKPSESKYKKVIEKLAHEPLGLQQLCIRTNSKQTQINVILNDLMDQKIIHKVDYNRLKKYELNPDRPELDLSKYEELRQDKLGELNHIVDYVHTTKPRMEYLCKYLGDDNFNDINTCDNTGLTKSRYIKDGDIENKLEEFHNNLFPTLEYKESKSNHIITGVATSYYGNTNVGCAVKRSKYEGGGYFPDFLAKQTLSAFRKHFKDMRFDLILFVPPTTSGDLVENFAGRISRTLKVPLSRNLIKTRETELQKQFYTSHAKKDNLKGAFTYTEPDDIVNKNILLIDDVYDSGITLKEIGAMLTKLGANIIAPLVIAKTISRDE